MSRLLQTSAVRLALKYLLAYALLLGLALGALWWSMAWFTDAGLDQALESEFRALLAQAPPADGPTLAAVLAAHPPPQRHYLLWSAQGEKLAGNLLIWPEESRIEPDGRLHRVWLDEDAFPAGRYEDEVYLPVIATTLADGSRLLLSGGEGRGGWLRELTEYLVQILGAAALLSLVLGVTLGRAILRRMEAIGRTASDIMAGNLSQRVPRAGRDDEFDRLAARLNQMLDRIQQLVRGLREVTDNVAHDLRRPLSRLRNRFEVTLLEARSVQEYRQVLQQGLEDVDALIHTFNALLGIAQTEAGSPRSDWGRVDLTALAQDLAELYAPAAEEQEQTLELAIAADCVVEGSRDLLAQALGNLLDNAIKYSPRGGRIRLELQPGAQRVRISISDNGPGIAATEREHVLERFVRLDGARHTPGNGLGLALVKAVAQLHRAELRLADAGPGLRVSLELPCRVPPPR